MNLAPMAIEKNKILGAVLELPIQPIWPLFVVNGLTWQCYLASSSKWALRIFFSIAICADYSFELNSIAT